MTRCTLVPPQLRGVLTLLVVVIAGAPYAHWASDKRDVVFECPCHAEWVATELERLGGVDGALRGAQLPSVRKR